MVARARMSTSHLSIAEATFVADVRHAIRCVLSPESDVLLFEEAQGLAPYGSAVLYSGLNGLVPVPVPIPVIRGQDNRSAMPPPVPGFIVLTPNARTRLKTNESSYADNKHAWGGSETLTESIQFELQIDCYGKDAGDWATALSIIFRDDAGVGLLTTCAPLYCDDPQQMPLVNGEEQYEERWLVRGQFEYDPSISLPMQFFDTAADPAVTIYRES